VPLRRADRQLAREFLAERPVESIHLAALLEQVPAGRQMPHGFWLVSDGSGPAALAQGRRRISFATRGGEAAAPRTVSALARVAARSLSGGEVMFGEEQLIRSVLEAGRMFGLRAAEIRNQELLAARSVVPPPGRPPVAGFRLRRGRRSDIRWLLESHAQMCREDLGVDQVARNRRGYEQYFVESIRAGTSLVGEIDGVPVFKAEYPVESCDARLVEGVYTHPSVRRRGVASWAMHCAIIDAARSGRTACLYVHKRNEAARRVYDRAGFEFVCAWLTVLIRRAGVREFAPVEY
jgi:GNAT superfamily N-acetyltransferase